MIYNQMVTWTAFAILAMFKIEERLLELELKHNASVVKLLELRANSSQLQVVVVLLTF